MGVSRATGLKQASKLERCVTRSAGREALCRYILRPPIAAGRVQLLADDLVRLVLKRPFSDGTSRPPTVRAITHRLPVCSLMGPVAA